jgi:hypothetical protein
LKIKNSSTWFLTTWLLRFGMMVVLFAASYVIFFSILKPADGYFVSRVEMTLNPFFWVLMGVAFIILGAYLRFRAMGPIVDKFKAQGLD